MTIKKLAALATAAALALCMLAGCFGGSRAMTSVLLDMLAGQYENVSFETDPELEDILRRAVRENDSEEDILAALEKALGAGTAFTDLAYGQQGEGAFDLIFYPGDDPEAAARSAYTDWAGVLGRLPGDGRYSAGLAMIETENGYYILIQNTVTQPAREPQEDEPEKLEEPQKPKDPYTKTGENSYTINTKDGLQKLYDALKDGIQNVDITLESDVELTVINDNGGEGWFIGTYGITYTGTFDGNDHIITISSGIPTGGLFDEIEAGGTVKNVKVKGNFTITGQPGNQYGAVANVNNGTVQDCTVEGVTFTGGGTFGGIVGENKKIVKNCKVTDVTVVVNSAKADVGGIVGQNSGTVEKCDSKNVTVTIEQQNNIIFGGVVGNNDGTVYNDCSYTGTVIVEGVEKQDQTIGGGSNTSLTDSEGGQQSAAVTG